MHQACLHNRRQKDGETVQEPAADVPSLASLAYQDLSPAVQERFATQHFIDAISDPDDRLRLRREKPCTLDDALSVACELEAYRLLDNNGWKRYPPRVRSLDHQGEEAGEISAELNSLRKQLQVQRQLQEAQQETLQHVVQQLQQLNAPPFVQEARSRPPSRPRTEGVQCWHYQSYGHYKCCNVTADPTAVVHHRETD